MTNTFGLRERKKALQKLNIAEAFLHQLELNYFEDIKVKTLCESLHISEVTFYKYFERKEEVLQLILQMWNYKREVAIQNNRPEGLKGIYRLFNDTADTYNSQKILSALISFIMKSQSLPKAVTLSDCEKSLLCPEHEIIQERSLLKQLNQHITEAIKMNELPKHTNVEALFNLLSTIYYGSPVNTHMLGISLKSFYKSNLDLIFNQVGGV